MESYVVFDLKIIDIIHLLVSRGQLYRFRLWFLIKPPNTADMKEGSIFTSMMSKGKDLSNTSCSMFTMHTVPHTVRGRFTLKDDSNKRAFPSGSFRELKITKESKDLAKVLLESL